MEKTSQKKRRINERRRQLYALRKGKSSSKSPPSTVQESAGTCNSYTRDARRKVVSRSLKVLPKNPEKFAEVISNIIQKSTPRKKNCLKEKRVYVSIIKEETI